MKILAVTCYTGGEELVEMTRECLWSLSDCTPTGVELQISSTAQGASRTIEDQGVWNSVCKNVGFAFGMNEAVDAGVDHYGAPDYVLCFNNDLQFPRKDWLTELLKAAKPNKITVPATDKAAIRIQPGPIQKGPTDHQEMSAYCWLVPFAWCKFLKDTYGFWLFDEDFAPGYGEDNWTAFLLSKQFGPNLFRYVHRSWVKHLKAQTSKHVKCDRKRTSALLVDKLRGELKDRKLRPDLRKWANNTIRVLSK